MAKDFGVLKVVKDFRDFSGFKEFHGVRRSVGRRDIMINVV